MRALLLGILLISAAAAHADRDGTWDFGVQLIALNSQSANGENRSSIDVDSSVGFGFGTTYNFNPHFSVGFDAIYAQADYEAVVNVENGGLRRFNHELDMFNGQINATWNLLDGPFTPFIRGGVGWTYIDSNIASDRPQTGCWWDPWWGYVCADFYDTFDDTSFSYGAAVGVRYDFRGGMYVKGSYDYTELNTDSDADTQFDGFRFELGWKLR